MFVSFELRAIYNNNNNKTVAECAPVCELTCINSNVLSPNINNGPMCPTRTRKPQVLRMQISITAVVNNNDPLWRTIVRGKAVHDTLRVLRLETQTLFFL